MIPRDYQQAAVAAVYDHLWTQDVNPWVLIPTAGGKTPVMAMICKDATTRWNGRVLVLADVKELLEQTADKLTRVCPRTSFRHLLRRPEASGPTRTGRRRRRLVGLPAERAPIRAAKVTCASPRSPERGWHDPCAVGRWLPVVGISRSERQLRSRRGSATAPCPPNRDCAARGDVVSRDHGRPGADQPRPLPAAP
ncbi:MAG: DEAD/DEAH box helicase family protein [Thermogemmata sp.]|nr:DEAD/DEAH box helicase family protein [Thermogemmata sp.]